MSNEIVKQDIQKLIDGWIEAEQNGEQFPVPFEVAWTIAGYARKDSGKRRLSGLKKGFDYSTQTWENGQRGRSSEIIKLSCDAMKHLCLMAETDEGRAIREYFIDAEKKWKLVQKHAPEVAQEVEEIHLKIELAKFEAQKEQAIAAAKEAEERILKFRHIVTTTMPEPIQQKVLGYGTIEKIEYRDRVLHNDDLINDGSTINKTELCHRYGILTRSGKPDYRRLKALLDLMPREAFDLTVRLQDNQELRRDFLPELDRLVERSERNLYLGE